MRNQIINDLYTSEWYNEMLSKITSNNKLKEELNQELMLILCEMDNDKLIKAHQDNYLKYLIINIAKKQYHSSTSPFHKKYRKYNYEFEDEIYKIADNKTLEDIDEFHFKIIKKYIDKLDITEREIIKMYFKLDDYDRHIGKLRDVDCDKVRSSTRKIEKKLTLKGNVPGSDKITIDHSTISKIINRVKQKIRRYLRNEHNIIIDIN